jgi:hypothetical protein
MRVSWNYILALVGGFILSIAFFVGCLYTQLGVPTHQSAWIYTMTQKKERLAAAIPGPRLLIVAGSSAVFGINAELIEKETGFPTINMGTHAGVLLDYRLDHLKKIVRPGDIILMAWEYEHYLDGYTYSAETTYDYILAHDPDYFRQMPLWDKIAMATRLPFKRIQKGWANRRHAEVVRPTQPPYSPYTPIQPGIDCLDDHGDEVFNMATGKPHFNESAKSDALTLGLPAGGSTSFIELADFVAWARDHHVTVLATYPQILWLPDYEKPIAKKTLETISQFYISHGVAMVGTAEDSMMHSADDFYDGLYHPTHEGAIKRTEQFIPALRPYLPASH